MIKSDKPRSQVSQGTVDNNLGPDRFVGPKALGPYHYRQPTLLLHDLSLEVLTVPNWGQGTPPTHAINVAHLTYQQ